ncbi:hypothetical protein [Neptunicella sp.]|uniref:hypothetical protein n=1 Tax=Neptunicella sp. TaxID=2125986 RepID=UPI003F693E3A
MDKAWIKIIKVTGAVGVVGLLLSLFMNHMFNEQIVNILGSEKLFFILVVIVLGLLLALLVAIIKPKSESTSTNTERPSESNKKIDITYDNGSTHNGDNNF